MGREARQALQGWELHRALVSGLNVGSSTPNHQDHIIPFRFYENLRISKEFPYLQLRNAVRNNPIVPMASSDVILEAINRGGYITFMQDDDRFRDKSNPYCDIVWIYGGMPVAGVHFVFRKGSPFTEMFNRAIDEEMVFIKRIYRKYVQFAKNRRERYCVRRKEGVQKFVRPLSIVPMLGLLSVFLCGTVAAILLLVLEIVLHRRGRDVRGKKDG